MSILHMPDPSVLSASVPPGATHAAAHAAAAHAAAHLRFGFGGVDDAAIKPLHQAVLGVLEDARVETLAMQELPGLRRLWRGFHEEPAAAETTLDALLGRLTRALFDPQRKESHPWVEKGRRLYLEAHTLGWAELRRVASILANDIGQMRLRFDAAGYRVQPAYRDDNTHLWHMPEGRAIASLQPLEPPDAEEAPGGGAAGARMDGDATELRLLGRVPEWDRLISRYRADWCTLVEMPPRESDPSALYAQLLQQAAWIGRLARRLRKAASASPRPVRTAAGVDVDEAALVDAGIALRTASPPDARLYLDRIRFHVPRRIVFILDASVSTGEACPSWLGSSGTRLLDGMARASMLACAAFEQAGHDCTILGFNSNTRHCVRIQPIKNQAEPVSSPPVLARLAGLTPDWSTRSGAAVRYAAQLLHHRQGGQGMRGIGGSLIVLVGDGHPHDIDMHDPRYLPEDLRRAARDAGRCGITLLNLELGSQAKMPLTDVGAHAGLRARISSMQMLADALVHAVRQCARR